MNLFKSLREELKYDDILQLDGAYAVTHINYNKSPKFNGVDGKDIATDSRKGSLSNEEKIEDVLELIKTFTGTEMGLKRNDRLELWKAYWLENINAFNILVDTLPESVVTVYVGRQALEIGFKYLLLERTNSISKTHELQELSRKFFSEYKNNEEYLNGIDDFCDMFCQYIEGGNIEYFRYPDYGNGFFAGNRLDIKWICYNFALILLKLLHFAGFDDEF